MSEKSEALRLADEIEGDYDPDWLYEIGVDEIAAELRRLHAECNDLARQLNESNERNGRLIAQRDALLEALKDAATSLATVGRLAGKSDYLGDDGERIPTYMGCHDEVREYATSRAGVARAAIKMVEEGK